MRLAQPCMVTETVHPCVSGRLPNTEYSSFTAVKITKKLPGKSSRMVTVNAFGKMQRHGYLIKYHASGFLNFVSVAIPADSLTLKALYW